MAYEGEVAAFWTMVDDGEPTFMRTPFDVERAVAETRASALAARAGVRRREPARAPSTATRRSRRSRARRSEGPDREGRPPARARRLVLRRAAERRRALVEDGRDASSPAATPVEVVAHRTLVGRPVIKLDRRSSAARCSRSSARQLPPTGEDEYYAFELVGLEVVEETGRALGTVVRP